MSLTPDQRIDRLTNRIAELPSWRIRKSVDIDSWSFDGEPIALGERWPRREGLARLEARAEIPETWPLGETRLGLNVGGESLLTLTYESGGSESLGLDINHEEFIPRARRFAILTESVARLPFGQPVREPRLERAELIWVDLAVERLTLLLTQIAEAARTLASEECVPRLLEIAETALRGLDWPSTTRAYVARVAPSRRQQTIWRLPETAANPEELDEHQRASVAATANTLTIALRELQSRFPPRGRIALTGHAHIDLAWLWPYEETRRKLRRTFHTALSLMERSPDFIFNQSTAHYYAQIEADDPDLFRRVREKAASGQWEALGGMWVEPDTNMPTGESLVRQLLYGQRYFERHFGARSTVCWLPDCFGFSPALPQLLLQAGISSFFTIKVNWSETNKFPFDLFWWEGLDGSRVLAHTFDNPLGGYNGRLRPDALAPTWRHFRGKTLHPETLLAVGYGDGGGGVTPEMLDRESQLRDFPALPRARWTTVASFFEQAHASARAVETPVWSGEIYLELHRATLTTQSGVKRQHRRAERALITAETIAGLAHLIGAAAPPNLETVWRVVLKNEFHDILPGSSIREVYVDAEAELGQAIEAGRGAQAAAMAEIAARVPEGSIADALIVVNPSLARRELRVLVEGDGMIASDDAIPPLGIVVLDRARINPTPGLEASETHLENAYLRVALGADGTIASLVHKPSGREALAGRGNQLWAYPQDKPRDWDAWDIDEDYARRGEEIVNLESLEVVETGPHHAGLRLTRYYRASRITQTLGLAANGRRLDIATEIEWRDRHVLLRTLTPAAVRARTATFECAHGVIERPTHRNTSWEAAMFEAVAHRFLDIGEPGFGVALLNDAKYGHSALGNVLGMSLVRSPVYPDPLADEGVQNFTYALMPHAGDWREGRVREEAEDLNQPLLVARAAGLAEAVLTPLGVAGATAALSTLKRAEVGEGLILRVHEPAGARGPIALSLPVGWRASGPLNLMEEPSGLELSADLRPFEVRSWRLTRE
jgi:alpha-mannosidase